MRIAELAGRRVAVWGYGREGRAALAALHARVPQVRPTLFCSEAEARALATPRHSRASGNPLRPAESQAPNLDSRFGGNDVVGVAAAVEAIGVTGAAEAPGAIGNVETVTVPPDGAALSAFDVVIKSPGISAYKHEILEAQHNGTRFTSGTALWFAENPQARVIAVTGTKGKSTVTALTAHLLRALGRRVALAGNIGLPLLELLDPPQAPDWWVVELSSFQTREAAAVEVAVLNNLYEEHLDWHGTRERYAADKLALAAVARTVVANAAQASLLARVATHPRVAGFGTADGWHVADGAVRRGERLVLDLARSPLPGPHNALNLCAALAALEAAGEDALGAAPAIAGFRALPHRLQTLGERDGRCWIDDSIATTPQATWEALASLPGRAVTVLVGGYERGLDWGEFAERVRERPPQAIVAMGANRARIEARLRDTGGAYRLESAASVDDAVRLARTLTPAGGVVLLSPGAPSFDQFKDYAERGRRFAALAGFDADKIGVIEGLGIA
jgi:UDP-N-acetylmuramoylalanine--D-glutamate ligase